jgi:NAD(P)-dependent dehydrogenase (short-subunit alcohol dehydrogenase family)
MTRITAEAGVPPMSGRYPTLADKRVFITGGACGIGACLVEAFARQGAHVACVDIAESESVRLADTLREKRLRAPWWQQCDVTDVVSLQGAIADAAAELGDFNVLVNNVASDDRHSISEVTPEYWGRRMAINQRPAFFAIQSVLPGMRRAGGGLHREHRIERLARENWRLFGVCHRQVIRDGFDPRACKGVGEPIGFELTSCRPDGS